LPELEAAQAGRIASAVRVSNPGCYPTGALALLKPLVDGGLVPADYPLAIHAVSGYSGRGRAGLGDHEGEAAATEGGVPGAPKKKRRRRKKKKPSEHAAASGKEGEPSRHKPHRASDRAPFHVGEEVFGKVTAVLDTAVMIDLSGKALAIFDRSEMEADDLVPNIGDRFVARVHNDGIRGGLVVLSRKPLREEEIKPKVEQAHKDGTLVDGLVTASFGELRGQFGLERDDGQVAAEHVVHVAGEAQPLLGDREAGLGGAGPVQFPDETEHP
jgi:hypothetical protein